MSESDELEPESNLLLETEPALENSDEYTGKGYWRQDLLLIVLSIVLAVSGSGVLVLVALGLVDSIFGLPDFGIAALSSFYDWLPSDSRGLLLIIGFALVAAVAYILLRVRISSNHSLYVGADCPQCGEHEFIRVRRNRWDRLLSSAGIPVRRYVCRNCSWDGLRVAKRLPGSEVDAIPPEMLLVTNEAGASPGEVPIGERN